MSLETVKVRSPTNIALIKYWGKHPKYENLHVPTKSSISFTVADLFTETQLRVKEGDFSLSLAFDGKMIEPEEEKFTYLRGFFDKILLHHEFAKNYSYHIETKSNFPVAAGFASSASGFSALGIAFAKIMERLGCLQKLDDRKLSVIARLGSGSAARSVPSKGGLVIWHRGWDDNPGENVSELSYAETLYPPSYFSDIVIMYAKVEIAEKKVKSRTGMKETVKTATNYWEWVEREEKVALPAMLDAVKNRRWEELFTLTKKASNDFHDVCIKTTPPIEYLNDASRDIIESINPLEYAAYTFDAGPNAVIFTLKDKVDEIESLLKGVVGKENIVMTKVGEGPKIIA